MIPERQTGGLRKPHTAGGSARPRGPRGRAVAWGTATAGPWPVPGRHAPADESPPCCPRGGKREWSGRPPTSLRAPVPKPPGNGGPPAAPPHSAGPSGASPARPPTGLQPPQVACVSRRCDPSAQSDARGCSVLTTETSDPAAAPAATRTRRRAGAGDVARSLRAAKAPDPPPRVSRRPLIHARGSAGLLVRVSRRRHRLTIGHGGCFPRGELQSRVGPREALATEDGEGEALDLCLTGGLRASRT